MTDDAMTDDATVERVAQNIWQEYAVETGRALPAGLADKLARAAVAALELTEETNAHFGDRYTDDSPATRRRLVGPWRPVDSPEEQP